jgi:aminopeptidase N
MSCKKNQIPEKGVSLDLAIERKSMIDSLEYTLFFSIPESVNDSVYGENRLSFHLNKRPPRLVLDFKEAPDKIRSISIGEHDIDYSFENEHIIIPSKYLRKGKNQVAIKFTAGNLSLNRQEEFMYSLFVPDRARTAFPCFDQPNLKANFTLTLEIPYRWVAVANGKKMEEIVNGNRKTIQFSKTQKLPTYLFAFATGLFDIVEKTQDGKTVKLFHREDENPNLEENLDEIFGQVFMSLEWMEEYTGIDYPFAKYDLVAIPSFQYGGMEHTGATLYRSNRIFLSGSPTEDQILARANLIAHETAHMWFGDLVTMEWFDEVWLKEVFANFIAEKITNPWFPDVNHNLKFLAAHYPAAYEIDRSQGANPIQQKLPNLNDAGTLYGNIIYHKAPIVMRKLEEITGEENLRKGLQKYLSDYSYGNATWNNLITILDGYTQTDLKNWSHTWVEEAGMPYYSINKEKVGYQVLQEDPSPFGRSWSDKVEIKSSNDSAWFNFSEKNQSLFAGIKPPAFFNTDGMGYGYFQLQDPGSYLEFFSEQYSSMDPVNRISQWLILYENILHGKLHPQKLLEKINILVRLEENPLILSEIFSIQRTLFWKFSNQTDRLRLEPEITEILWEKFHISENRIRKSIFNQLVNLSISDSNLVKIYAIWENKGGSSIALSTNETMDISFELLLKMPDKYKQIMESEESFLSNPDDLKEFRYTLPALHPDKSERQKFFLGLEDPENRERESWVITAVSYLNHPLRQEEELNNLYYYLELLPEIKETGDIFFPKRWLDAVLWGHNSHKAKLIVDTFIEENPDLPPSLHKKLQQSADLLYRAESIVDWSASRK